MGKTTLLDAFAAAARGEEHLLSHVHLDATAPRPYEIWRQVVRDLAAQGIRPPREMTPTYRTVLQRLQRSHFNSRSAGDRLPPLPAEQMRYRAYDAVWQLLRFACLRRPLVVLVDDLQFADVPSLKLLRHILAFVPSVPVLLAVACDSADPVWTPLAQLDGAIRDELRFEHIVLGGLSPSAVRELASRLGVKTAGSDLAGLTCGSPLHVHLLAQLVAEKDPKPRAGTPALSRGELRLIAASAGRTFAHLVSTRLSAPERGVLEAAAVFPQEFSPADVATVRGSEVAGTAKALKHLVEGGYLAPAGAGRGRYRFRHHMFRSIMLERLDASMRSALTERALARTLTAEAEGAEVWQRAEWSHDLRGFAKTGIGPEYCRRAAEEARQLSAPEHAADNLAKAVDVMAVAGRSDFTLLSDHAHALTDVGEFEEAARSAWRAVDAVGGHARDEAKRREALVSFAMRLHDGGAPAASWGPFRDKAMTSLEGTRDLNWARLRVLDGGKMRKISGPPLQVGRWLGLDPQAVEIMRQEGDEQDYCRTLFVYDWHGIEDIDALLARVATWKSTANVARGLSVAAETLMYRHGEFDRACELLERQRRLHEETGSIVEQAKSLVRLTMGLLAAGELDEAIATRARARDMVDRLGPGYLIYEHAGTTRGGDLYPEISMESNFAWYVEGNWLAVAEHWAHAIGLEEPGGSPVHIVETAMAAQAYARIDRFEDARFYLNELTKVLKHLQPRDWAFNGAVGRASHAIWDMAAVEYAETYRNHALRLLAAGVGDWTNTSLELTVARMAALLGRGEEAGTHFRAARQKLSRKRADPRKAIMDFDEAVSLRLLKSGEASRRASLLESARSVFERRNMHGWMRRLEDELRRV